MPLSVLSDPDLRRVLETWALLTAAQRPVTAHDLCDLAREQSAHNLEFRPDSTVQLAPDAAERLLSRLRQRGLIKPATGGAWVASARGRSEAARLQQWAERADVAKQDAAEQLVARLRRMVPGPAPRALDVGTGGGFMACLLAQAGFAVVGVDRWAEQGSHGGLEEACRNAAERGLRIQFLWTDVVSLRGRSRFDCAVASNSVHEMPDPAGAFRAVHRLLKPGGVFAGLDLKVGELAFLRRGFHSLLALTERQWRDELHAAGFPYVRIHDLGNQLLVFARKPRPSPADRG